MTRWLMIVVSILAVTMTSWAGVADQWTTAHYLPGRLIVDFTPAIHPHVPTIDSDGTARIGVPSLDAAFAELGVWDVYRLVPDGILGMLKTPPDMYHTYVVVFDAGYPVLNALERLSADTFVRDVTPDLLYEAYRIPNDPLWPSMWDKRLIGADVAWDFSVGDSTVICAGIDTGVDWNHPDLGLDPDHLEYGTILWVNPQEDLDGDRVPYNYPDIVGDTDDQNGIDDGGNNYVDDFIGWDFIRNIGGCAPGEDCDSQMDNNMFGMESHGTHVAGTMAAHGNNGIGVTGVAWNARLMALRAGYLSTNQLGYMPESATIPAIAYAAANGARIINMSYGGNTFSSNSQAACNSAWNQGCILFAASGNSSSSQPHYPAANANVVAVNSIDDDNGLSYFSNRGTWTDLCSPGGDPGIWSTINDGYGGPIWQGTSMASPNAAGVAALLWGIFPQMSNVEMVDFLLNTAVDITAQNPGIPPGNIPNGRVDARSALSTVFPHLTVVQTAISDAAGDNDGRLENGETATIVFTLENETGWATGTDLTVNVSSPVAGLTVTNGSFAIASIAPGQSASNQSDPVSVSASGFTGALWAELDLTITAPSGYHVVLPVLIRVGRGQVLIVDDDGSANYETYYEADVTRLGLTPDVWSTSNAALPAGELSHYSTVIWSCGNESSNTLTAQDQANLTQFLNNGGNLLIVGQNIPEDIGSTSFHTEYLHAQDENLTGNRQLDGIPGNIISDGRNLLLLGGSCAGNGTVGPSRILPVNGGEAVYNYTQGGIGAVMYAGTYKVVYFSCALEAACGQVGTAHHEVIVETILNWFGIVDVPRVPDRSIPSSIALRGNFPNPFNPATTIAFDLPSAAYVTLAVFDVLGRNVATLVDDRMSAGTHAVEFDGSALSSGLYIARLTSGAQSVTAKMVLMK